MLPLVYPVCLVLLSVSALLVVVRLLRGPTTADRVIAADALLLMLIAGLAVRTAQLREPRFVVLIVIVALLGFVATVAAARFLERREEGS